MAHDDEHDDASRGMRDIARSFLDHGGDYVEARLELARLEADEASEHLVGLSTRLAVGLFAAISGYTACLIAGIALLFGDRWEIPALVAAALHLFVGGLFLIGARRQAKLSKNLFASTRRELQKDQQWLKQKSRPDDDAGEPS